MDPEDFVIPDFDAPLDIDAAIGRTPVRVTTKGMFNTSVAKAALRAAPLREADLFAGSGRSRWAPFLDYSLRDHMRLLSNAADVRFGALSKREGLRRLGWTAFPTFAESMTGKVLLAATGVGVDGVLAVGGRAISLSISEGSGVSKRLADRHWQLDYTGVYCFLDSYHVGVIEGVVRAFGRPGDVRVQMRSAIDGTFDVRW